jgi:hypothetical protein
VRTRTAVAVVVLLSVLGVVLSSGALAVAAGVTLSAFLRYWGLALELVGLGAIAWGLIDLREKFTDRPSLVTRVRLRLSRARRLTVNRVRRLLGRPVPPTVVSVGTAGAVGLAGSVTIEVGYGAISARLPVSERLAQLDARTREIQDRVNRLQRQVVAEIPAREAADADERAARRAADEGLDNKLTDLAAGGLTVEWWGLAALVVGTVLDAIPDELANLFS